MKFSLIVTFLITSSFAQQKGERIEFTSSNPFSFYHIITDLENQEPQKVYGILRFPEGVERKNLPMVFGVAGSLAWSNHHLEYLKMYRDMGMATFELKSFASRDITSTVGTQVEVTSAMMILDAYKALAVLGNDPRIDIDRVAITGWSLGGSVALFSAWQPLKNAITSHHSFKAHLPIYPPCIVNLESVEFSDEPIHILIGELDNWVPATACEDMITDMQAAGADANITIYPNAHHSFDHLKPPEIVDNGYILTDCRFRMRTDGAILMNFFDIPMITPLRQKIALALCASRGPTFGGNPEARDAAFKFSKQFMADNLLVNATGK